jgi:hypothetical protein
MIEYPLEVAQRIAEHKRIMRRALEAIVLHDAMPDGESWEEAYREVVAIAKEAVDATATEGTERRV